MKRGRRLRLQPAGLTGQGARESQQDSLGLKTLPGKGTLAVVADGMGGLENGAELSRLAVETALAHFEQTPAMADPVLELCDLGAKAAQSIRQYLLERPQGGTTLVLALVREGGLSFLSVGDSRLCLVRGGGLIWLSRPHSYAAQLAGQAVRGEGTLSQVLRDPQRQALTSFLGSVGPPQVDFPPEPIPLLPRDRVLLLTDGIFGTLSPQEIAAAAALPAKRAAKRLEKAVQKKAGPHQDNYTALILAY